MTSQNPSFSVPARVLHWLMAVLIIAMLFVGAGMISTVSARYPQLLALHRPLGIAILLLVWVAHTYIVDIPSLPRERR
ncbi:cytochrome b [Burkholderia ambifaria]|jgi:cytochrome b561|uniref:Cytochrome b561 bacterial/Ni-hydrogenase domain-containing protein n=1 Tax=Burkholderia ambifaria IOP40-10 TaxID=396596 RepID=B1FQE2_9BURK|nr:cytochrome b/b6 domain-containing protein [Burkholderia ambifaria]EDT00227.1 hypothetical protein BamIOP4010DRAFT_6258 [Burkholderia ambifaria IOP40-10]